jgi:FixJ family two-component response regulator
VGEPALIFAVDDDPGFLASVVRLLRSYGLQVRAFPSAEALQQHGDLSSAACLLLDIHLGGISGIELHRQLKRDGSLVPVVFMTGVDSAATRREAEEEGCLAYLRKPFVESDLINAIKQAGGLAATMK